MKRGIKKQWRTTKALFGESSGLTWNLWSLWLYVLYFTCHELSFNVWITVVFFTTSKLLGYVDTKVFSSSPACCDLFNHIFMCLFWVGWLKTNSGIQFQLSCLLAPLATQSGLWVSSLKVGRKFNNFQSLLGYQLHQVSNLDWDNCLLSAH